MDCDVQVCWSAAVLSISSEISFGIQHLKTFYMGFETSGLDAYSSRSLHYTNAKRRLTFWSQILG